MLGVKGDLWSTRAESTRNHPTGKGTAFRPDYGFAADGAVEGAVGVVKFLRRGASR